MKKLLLRCGFVILSIVCLEFALLELVPKDKDSFLYEYNHKLDLLRNTPSPRIIVVGGSSVAFNTNCQMILDSLHFNAINFGLHAGAGARVPILDCLPYIKKGDIVVMQIEYSPFFNGGYGEVPVLTSLMVNKNWENASNLDKKSWEIVIQGIPKIAFSNFKRLITMPFAASSGGEIAASSSKIFVYSKSGFNEYGDEISHYNYHSLNNINFTAIETNRQINEEFLEFLREIFTEYEKKGATVIMMPPSCIDDYFEMAYDVVVEQSLLGIGYPYVINPKQMTLPNDYAFDTKYHLNRDGVVINTNHIIYCLKDVLK